MAPHRPRVLVADDEPQVRSLVRAFLVRSNFDVLEACDGVEALESIQKEQGRIDLLITDIKMPRMDGMALARSVAGTFPRIPVLFISGFVSEPEQPADAAGQRRDFLQKPFLPNALRERVSGLIGAGA